MKILVDVDDLLERGMISADTATILKTHARRDVSSTAINILIAFGSVAVAAGLVALTISAEISCFFGLMFILLGWLTVKFRNENWGKLGSIWMIVGALVLAGSLGFIVQTPLLACILAIIIFSLVGILVDSKLLIALVPMALEAAIGGSTGYWTGCYEIVIEQPTLTILLFGASALGMWRLSPLLPRRYEGLTLTFIRMSLIFVNLGFWVGSLFGDFFEGLQNNLDENDIASSAYGLPPLVFIIIWALALLFTGIWAAKNGRRALVNIVATFAAIHFYTQWFERLGAEPLAVIAGGVVAIAFGYAFWRYNRFQQR